MEKVMIRENTGTMFMEDEISNDFTPYQKVAVKIDEVLAALSFTKMIGDFKEAIRLNAELELLQSQITEIQKRNRRR